MRFCATVVGAYVIFGFTMYTMLDEFQWFTRYRYQFLSKPLPRNYCVYVQCIPKEFRTNQKLLHFFQQSSSQGAVLEAHLAVKTPTLKKKVAEREALVAKLEHAINVEQITGTTLSQRRIGLLRTGESLVDALLRQLEQLNQTISESIDRIQSMANETSSNPLTLTNEAQTLPTYAEERLSLQGLEHDSGFARDPLLQSTFSTNQKTLGPSTTESTTTLDTEERTSTVNQATRLLLHNPATNSIRGTLKTAVSAAGTVANVATSLLTSQDGEPLSAGFVTFKSLRAVQAAKQMIQYAEPFAMEVLEAPQPEGM
jgi:hypothetical protein